MSSTRSGRVVVITGASSGIGRATAYAFAERGDHLVLAARRAERLEELAEECRALGAEALPVPTDMTDEAQVRALAGRALAHFGRIDVWFNNAGVGVFGRFEDIPSAVWRRVIETNLFGYVHGARAVMPVFRRQGHGVLIQNASIAGLTAKPDSTAYAASKFAVRGFSEALRQEVLDDPGIRICTLLPAVIDTPFFQHAANYSHHRVRAAPPVYRPEKVARAVLDLAERPRAETVIGGFGHFGVVLKRLAPPSVSTWLSGRLLNAGFLAREASPETSGALFAPMVDTARVRGGWRRGPNNGGVPLAAFGVLAAALLLRRLTR